MHQELAQLLHEADIHPISLASDGVEVKRAAPQMNADSAADYYIYHIPNPTPGCQLTLKIPLYNGRHPTLVLQDSKRALKTARNQILMGARILVMGFFVILYTQIRDLAANIAGPLFTRNVEKVDKQDDRAAARMFSGNTLEFQLKNYPGQTGLSVYLFVLGEMIDAWQNRNISHRDRTKMVLRARFFLMAWRSHIQAHPEYTLQTQFISRESYDIFLTICDGLLSLMVAYRKSTVAVASLDGDILYLEHKLRVLMMGAFGNLSPDQQENQTSAGYVHTYFKADDLDLAALKEYPTDKDLANASKFAVDEASQLLNAVGIDAGLMLREYQDPEPSQRQSAPPSARSQPPQTILELMAMYLTPKTSRVEEIVEACEMALAAEGLNKSLAIAALPDSTQESLDDLGLLLEAILTTPLKEQPVRSLADYALPLTLNIEVHDFILIAEHMRHQTKSTAKAVRQYGRLSTIMEKRAAGRPDSESGPSLRQMLLQRLAAAVPISNDLNRTTGVDRRVRHAGTFGGSGAQADVRVQNKATVKSVAAAKFGVARAKAFANVQWMHENMYLAGITELNPLKPDDFVIVLKTVASSPEVVLGTVITMYTKNTAHDWIPNTSSIGTPSYICILAYRQFVSSLFSSVACEKLLCPTVLQIPHTHILFSLASFKIARQSLPTAEGYPHTMATLCPASFKLFQTLCQSQ
ncbi:hypothetical protein K438DRAFT_2024000 [Mycena galopus ATCC 62051]|nr:hypothetical protein K438DRAFT_2024000 [Mycena galopus ATCC 62051]